jgi:F0F1-type ATP synthase assembly protein I
MWDAPFGFVVALFLFMIFLIGFCAGNDSVQQRYQACVNASNTNCEYLLEKD